MKLSIYDHETGDSLCTNTEAVVLLVHNTRGQYAFFKGKSELVYPIFMHGYKHWPLVIPKSDEVLQAIDRSFEKIQIPKKDIFIVSKELLTGEYKTPDKARAGFLLEDVGIRDKRICLSVENAYDTLCFYDKNGEKDIFASGHGSEKSDLSRFGANLLFGEALGEELHLINFGGSKSLRQIDRYFLEMRRNPDEQFKLGEILISPEVAKELLENQGIPYQEERCPPFFRQKSRNRK